MLTNTTSAPKTHKLIILNKLHANRHRTHVSIIDTYIHNLLLNLYHNSKFLNFLIFNMPARNKKQQKYETQTLKMTLTQISHHFSRKSPPLVLLSITPCDCLWTLHPLPPHPSNLTPVSVSDQPTPTHPRSFQNTSIYTMLHVARKQQPNSTSHPNIFGTIVSTNHTDNSRLWEHRVIHPDQDLVSECRRASAGTTLTE